MVFIFIIFFCIRPPPELLPVLGPLERYMTPTLDAALLYSSRAGSDLGRTSVRLRSFLQGYIAPAELCPGLQHTVLTITIHLTCLMRTSLAAT